MLVLTGQHTNIRHRHTSADAFFRGYRLLVPEDAVEAISAKDQAAGLHTPANVPSRRRAGAIEQDHDPPPIRARRRAVYAMTLAECLGVR
ncbi:MAG: isochorismatase family protein [Candidatus Limnocylindrales bacterium]